ncbi:uncharacterized protein LOC128086992 isoform X1 [Tympanuchus pallidicinctus]|uniref:uncharacterized protein LOC128086992 isoform X1 n=1 Tax=Tympanuchus pallidicinctus TaxID=109042 RepID=UPI002286EACB|nr:uncharacterized protein LOC128086992 isoform X1 [Tympanuchus pallidicinctus]XP_052552075.1 uncharacterized protein LOC128086992 isoform X1 [Tympanuchus pallidicinctus]
MQWPLQLRGVWLPQVWFSFGESFHPLAEQRSLHVQHAQLCGRWQVGRQSFCSHLPEQGRGAADVCDGIRCARHAWLLCEGVHLCSSASLRPPRAADNDGPCLLKGQERFRVLLYAKNELNPEDFAGGGGQLELAVSVGGQQLEVHCGRLRHSHPGFSHEFLEPGCGFLHFQVGLVAEGLQQAGHLLCQLVLRVVEEAHQVWHVLLRLARALALHADAGVPHPYPLSGAHLQLEDVARGCLQGHEHAVDSVAPIGTPAFKANAHPNGWLQPWHEVTLGNCVTDAQKFIHQLLHHLALVSPGLQRPNGELGVKPAHVGDITGVSVAHRLPHLPVAFVPKVKQLLGQLCCLPFPVPFADEEEEQEKQQYSQGPHFPGLQCREVRALHPHPALLRVLVFCLQQQLCHLLLQIRLILLRVLMRVRIQTITKK